MQIYLFQHLFEGVDNFAEAATCRGISIPALLHNFNVDVA